MLIGSINFIGSLGAYFTVKNFGRVPVLYLCHFGMAITLVAMGVCARNEYNFAAVMLLLFFILLFQLS